MPADAPPPLTFDDFLRLQTEGTGRLEFVAGRVYAMAGGTERHDLTVGQLVRRLVAAEDRGCRVFSGNRLLRTRTSSQATYYPDLLVGCAPAADPRWEDDATLIVEVLSPRTRDKDRREKALAYATLPSLRAYVLVDLELRVLEVQSPPSIGWSTFGAGEVYLSPFGALDVDELFDAVDRLATT